MKKLLFALTIVLLFTTCSKDKGNDSIESCNQPADTYTSMGGTTVNLTQQKWYLTKQGDGGSINLIIEGTTNGDSATIVTFGDGLIGEVKVVLDAQKHFYVDQSLVFYATSRPPSDITCSTTLTIYKGSDIYPIPLSSCPLRY